MPDLVMTEIDNRFAPKGSLIPTESEQAVKYDHGYTEEQVILVTNARKELDKRDLVAFPVTLDEFKAIIIPFQRISRTTAFNLNPEKPKKVVKEKGEKLPATRKPRVAKVVGEKKLTKKAIEEKLSDIIFKLATGTDITDEEQTFFTLHTTKSLI
jgi:hypothetical protein